MRFASGTVLLSLVLLSSGWVAFAQLSPADVASLQQEGTTNGWTFTVDHNAATQVPIESLCGLVEPPGWQQAAPLNSLQVGASKPQNLALLPAAFDWRNQVGCPPIRSQGSCGACWAFSTVGAFECAIRIMDGKDVDLSEQWLISCNQDGWSCIGGWFAHDYHRYRPDSCSGTGAVLESIFPYRAANVACQCPYTHEYFIDSWGYIDQPGTIPTVDAIKRAIMQYGPVSVAVYAGPAFQAYSGGVFNACENKSCNHAVVLVGWDDNQGPGGVWIVRNSWGAGWGEAGYGRMLYGCSNIGYGACYIVYPGWDELVVGSPGVFACSGDTGGPFAPTSTTYTLTNRGSTPVNWSAACGQTWLDVSPATGSLAGGTSVNLVASITSAAAALAAGTYSDSIRVTNTETGKSWTRDVTLTVGKPDYFTEMFSLICDWGGRSVTFSPNNSTRHYSACGDAITALPTNPAGGTPLPLADDDFAQVSLNGVSVSLYGQPFSSFFVGSNGYITFDAGDKQTFGNLTKHFSQRRISGLFDNLNPAKGGTVSWQQFIDRVVVTWLNVPEAGSTAPNTFQIVMFFDGRIRLAWLTVAGKLGVAGLSNGGGLPADYVRSDLSKYPTCPVPLSPADLDRDGDVDQDDLAILLACVTGPDLGPLTTTCRRADLDLDGDVDQSDFGLYQRCFSGRNKAADPACLN